jgi:MSHA biogenesis protein MshM
LYQAHFGLRELPFGITPDTSYTFACRAHQDALNTLLIAVANGEGFMKVIGEVGTGKTLLCRRFLALLDERFVTAYIPNPYLEPRSLLLALADELRIRVARDADQHVLLKKLNAGLLAAARAGKSVVLCLDEAQAMPIDTLEALRLLTNLETEKRKLLQVVLFGQPELDARLRADSVRQLRQRITFQCTFTALSRDETARYVEHRLRIADRVGPPLFRASALRRLHQMSKGVPRLINILANKALLLAYGEGAASVTSRHVRTAQADTPVAIPRRRRWWWYGFTMALLSLTSASMTLLH